MRCTPVRCKFEAHNHEIHACEVHAHEVHARDIRAYGVHAREIYNNGDSSTCEELEKGPGRAIEVTIRGASDSLLNFSTDIQPSTQNDHSVQELSGSN